MRAAVLAAALFLCCGCSALASDGATLGCQVADAGSTVAALQRGAVEKNPLWAQVIERAGLGGFVFLKIALAVAVIRWLPANDDATRGTRAAVNVATCAAASHNLLLMR